LNNVGEQLKQPGGEQVKQHVRNGFGGALRECLLCVALGLKSALSRRALLSMLALWALAAVLVGMLFFVYREELAQAALFLAALVVYGAALLSTAGHGGGVVSGGVGGAMAVFATLSVGAVLFLLLFMLVLFIVVRVLTELRLMKSVQRQALQSYALGKVCINPGQLRYRRS
jgi:hypothetical protein